MSKKNTALSSIEPMANTEVSYPRTIRFRVLNEYKDICTSKVTEHAHRLLPIRENKHSVILYRTETQDMQKESDLSNDRP